LEKANQEAAVFYENISNNILEEDIKAISRNTGIPEFQIKRIKQHLFFNYHELAGGMERFAPDFEIADAWFRLKEGNFVEQDINLLQHEYYESRFEGIFKTDYITAHNAANDSGRKWEPEAFTTEPSMRWRK
jgi:hypothetical protein